MEIHRTYNPAGPAAEAVLLRAFMAYLAAHAGTAPGAADARAAGAA